MKDLEEKLEDQIIDIKKQGDDLQMRKQYIKAIEKYEDAIKLIPEPIEQWTYIRVLWLSIAENYWLNAKFKKGEGGGYYEALEVYRMLMKLPRSVGKSDYHAKIGQIRYELGDIQKAKDELIRSFLLSGMQDFDNMDSTKYFDLIKPIVEGKEKDNYSADSDSYAL